MASALEEAKDFVRDALSRGHSREEIEQALLDAGWPPAQVQRALGAYAASSFNIPVPRPHAQLSARQAFIYLLLFTVLLVVAVQLGNLLFQIINISVPDVTESQYREAGRTAAIRFAIASLIVAFPLFVFLSLVVSRELKTNPAMRLSAVRRWLTYLALFIAATVFLGDLITVLNGFLNGELTTRFSLKALTVAGISGGIFCYYFFSLSSEERSSEGK